MVKINKSKTIFHHRGTEGTEGTEKNFYDFIVICACGAANNKKGFLCALCASVVKNSF